MLWYQSVAIWDAHVCLRLSLLHAPDGCSSLHVFDLLVS